MDAETVHDLLERMGFLPYGCQTRLDGVVAGEAVRYYQLAFAGSARGEWLAPDGIAGPQTQARLERWGTKLSTHFDAVEFIDRREHTNGIDRELVHRLEVLRTAGKRPVLIRSGFRTHRTNEAVGGAPESMHMVGAAADIGGAFDYEFVRKLSLFSGIGVNRRSKTVRHVDIRGMNGAPNHTGGKVTAPTVWFYD